jgi:plastocyanin
MSRLRILAVATVLAGTLAACSSSSSSSATPPSTANGHTVTIKNFAFSPASLTVKTGTKVTFINEDTVQHDATSQGSSTIKSPTLNNGQSYTVTFTKAGTYRYICTIHPNMNGTVIVH